MTDVNPPRTEVLDALRSLLTQEVGAIDTLEHQRAAELTERKQLADQVATSPAAGSPERQAAAQAAQAADKLQAQVSQIATARRAALAQALQDLASMLGPS